MFFQGLGLQGALVIPGFDILGGAVDFRVTRARWEYLSWVPKLASDRNIK